MTLFPSIALTFIVMTAIAFASPGAEMSQPEEPEIHVYYHDVPTPRSALPASSHYQVGDRIVPEVQVRGAGEVYHHPIGTHNEPMPRNWQIHIPDDQRSLYGDPSPQQLICGPQGCLPTPPIHQMQGMSLGSSSPHHSNVGMMSPYAGRGRANPSQMRMQWVRGDPGHAPPSSYPMPPQGQYGPPMMRPGLEMNRGPSPTMRGRGGIRGRLSPRGRGMPMNQGMPGDYLPPRPHLAPHPRIQEIQELQGDDMPPPMRVPSRRGSPRHSSPQHLSHQAEQQAPPPRRPTSRQSSRASSVYDEEQ